MTKQTFNGTPRPDCVKLKIGDRVISTFDYGKHNPMKGTVLGWFEGEYAPGFYAISWDLWSKNGWKRCTNGEAEPHDDGDVELVK